jgi:hypothetical protein
MAIRLTKQHVADLLENFADYTNPSGRHDPWFTIDEVVRQFPFEVPLGQPVGWLDELVAEGLVERASDDVGPVWAWADR